VKKFIVIYHAPASANEQMAHATPEQMQEAMKPWMAWAERCGSSLVDLGNPLGNGQRVSKSGAVPSHSDVGGYSILQAEDMAAAKGLLNGHPHLDWGAGCEIEVYEAMPM
jgi:hypothetical protein